MKKLLLSSFLFAVATGSAFAQTTTQATSTTAISATSQEAVSAGLTPESPFYFFDKITESLQELFAFTPDAKIKLQLAFAAERVAEAKAMLATQGDHSKGLDVIHASITENVQKTSEILKKEKSDGNDVAELAKEANDEFDSQESELNKSLSEAHKDIVEKKIEEDKHLLEDAKASKDEAKINEATQNLNEHQQIAQDLKVKREEIKKSFHDEKKSIEEEMSKDDQEKDEVDNEQEDAVDAAEIEDNQSAEVDKSHGKAEVRTASSTDDRGDGEDGTPDGRR